MPRPDAIRQVPPAAAPLRGAVRARPADPVEQAWSGASAAFPGEPGADRPDARNMAYALHL